MIKKIAHSPIKAKPRQSCPGYGLLFLIIFLSTTILVTLTASIMTGSFSTAYLGSVSQNSQAAKQVALIGLVDAETDIKSKLNSMQSVTTSYSLTNSSVQLASNPATPGTLDTTFGSYTVTLTYARGNCYVLKSVGTVGTQVASATKVLNLSTSITRPLDTVTGATAAYSLRRLSSAYSGPAIRIRRSIDNAETDIGFNSSGYVDVAAINSFMSVSTLPLDAVPGAVAAFSFRKLRSAYTGPAMRVRRDDDNVEQDIGFVNGDMDYKALAAFLGTSMGYVSKWYDQSGNGNDAVQSNTALQPLVSWGVYHKARAIPTR